MSTPHKAAALAGVLVALLLFPVSSPARAADPGPSAISLYGDSARGWGLNSSNITSPGPTLTVTLGETVTLELIGVDGSVLHNWFIDYDKNNQTNPGEPVSPDFMGPGPLLFPFVPDRAGNWTYKCIYHFGMMFGTIRVVLVTNVTLYADSTKGWGLTNATIRSPGPTLIFLAGTNVTLTLIANDSVPMHNFFIDYDGDGQPSVGDLKTNDFAQGSPLTVTIPLTLAGNFTYYCQYHSGLMKGNVLVLGVVVPRISGFNVALIPGIMSVALGGVLVFAAVYHVRAVRAAKRAK